MFVKNEGNAEPNGIACDLDQTVIRTPIRPRPSDCEYDWGQSSNSEMTAILVWNARPIG
jgi:hypothetical protein